MPTDEELLEYSRLPRYDIDWSASGSTAVACERKLIDAIETLQEDVDVRPFCTPVNLDEYPEYSLNVDYPIDLGTIAERAANQYYRFALLFLLLVR